MSLRFNGCSIITIDQRIPGLPIPSVVSNNYDGGYVCVKRLTELGHRRIAYVSCTHVEIASSVRERFHGYCSALYEHGINIDPDITIFDYVMDTEGDRVGAPASYGEQLLLRLRSLGVTSIVTEHDFLASELLRHAVHLNIKVPEELSVVGFDDLDLASRLPTPLTTVRQNFYEIGRKAAELAVRFMTTNAGVDDETHVVPVRFVERMTTGPVKEMGGNA